MGNFTIFQMFENPRRGRHARNFTTNVPKILDLESSSEQIFSENWRWVPLFRRGFSRQSFCKSILVGKLCMVQSILFCRPVPGFNFPRFPWGPVHTYPYSFENATLFLRFPIKFLSTRSIFASFSPVHTCTMNRFENDNLPDCGCLTHTCSLLWVPEIVNLRHLWISLVWVYIVVTFFKVTETV